MNLTPGTTDTPQIAIWFFVAATFIFAAPTLFFPEADLWARIVLIAVGLLAIVGGGIQLGREITQRRVKRDEPPTPNSDTGDGEQSKS